MPAKTVVTTEDRRRWGRIGGLKVRARHDPAAYTHAARTAFLQSFYDATPANLPEDERRARAEAARRAHMLTLAERSAAARRSRARSAVAS